VRRRVERFVWFVIAFFLATCCPAWRRARRERRCRVEIIINPETGWEDRELRSDEALVVLGGQSFRLPRELVANLDAVITSLVFARGS
jgi:hypothetical protein